MKMKVAVLHQLAFTLLTTSFFQSVKSNSRDYLEKALGEEKKATKLPPCSACTRLVQSFTKGLERTERGKFEGGDAAWEEKNQGKGYAISEVRFVEIQEKLCQDVARGEAQCHNNHHEWEEHLEEWWSLGHDKPDLREWLCISKLKVCCPEGHFGAQCTPCSRKGANGHLCSGHGKCKGSGTRKGNGACQCDKGYGGDACHQCSSGYFRDNDQCSSCHKSCLDQCVGPEPTHCLACQKGYVMKTERGCVDVDECAEASKSKSAAAADSICRDNEFCVNLEGSHSCHRCHVACSSCTGDGPDECTVCAEGYTLSGHVCIDADSKNETSEENDDASPMEAPEAAAVETQKLEL